MDHVNKELDTQDPLQPQPRGPICVPVVITLAPNAVNGGAGGNFTCTVLLNADPGGDPVAIHIDASPSGVINGLPMDVDFTTQQQTVSLSTSQVSDSTLVTISATNVDGAGVSAPINVCPPMTACPEPIVPPPGPPA